MTLIGFEVISQIMVTVNCIHHIAAVFITFVGFSCNVYVLYIYSRLCENIFDVNSCYKPLATMIQLYH